MAEGTAAAAPQSKSASTVKTTGQAPRPEGSGVGLVAGIIMLACVPLFLLIGLTLGMFRASGPNPGGASIPQKIVVANATPEVRKLLDTFNCASDAQGCLTKNVAVLDGYVNNLTLLLQKVQSNDPAFANMKDRNGVIALIPVMIQQVATLKTDITAAQKDKLVTDGKAFQANIQKMDFLALPDISGLALNYAAQNEASGYTKFQYSSDVDQSPPGRSIFFDTGVGTSDCSAFVSAMLYQSGYIRVSQLFNTISLYQAAKSNQFGLQIILESTSGAGLDHDTVQSTIRPGDILLSSNNTTFADGADSGKHAVLFVGNGNVVESTNANNKNGIQVDSLTNRLEHHGAPQVIIRGGGQ